MPTKDLMYLIQGEVTRTRAKPPLRPAYQREVERMWQSLPERSKARAFEEIDARINKQLLTRRETSGGIGVTHREVAAQIIRGVRKEARPQGLIPDLIRSTGKGMKKALNMWQDLPPKYRSRVGFEVHGARAAGATAEEQAMVARKAAERLAMRQAAREVGNQVNKLRGFTGLLGPLTVVSEVLGYVADRRQGVKYPEPLDYDQMPVRPRKMPTYRAPKV